jgi:hypothetical protein
VWGDLFLLSPCTQRQSDSLQANSRRRGAACLLHAVMKNKQRFQKESCKFYEAQRAAFSRYGSERGPTEEAYGPHMAGITSGIIISPQQSLSHTQKSLDLLKITALLCWRDRCAPARTTHTSSFFTAPALHLSIFTVVGVCLRAGGNCHKTYLWQ